ncbi:MAG: undecaprenyl-diphosphate phosphatase [Rikenellaceae bacterium]
MTIFEAAIMGLIQGLTEFLPVSSSGHLEIASHILGVNSESNLLFTVVVHAGTVLSTIVVFWKDIMRIISSLLKFQMNDDTQFVLKIFISLIPIMVVGFTLKDKIESLFGGTLLVVGCLLVVTSLLLWFSNKARPRVKGLTYANAFWIGMAQAFAVLPGISRSGSTISTGLLLGVKREEVARFSFLMVLIPIIGVNFLEIVGGEFTESLPLGVLITGFLTSFVSGALACRLMIRIVNSGKLYIFAIYCALVGIATITYSLLAQ